jgi:hypothetical protein
MKITLATPITDGTTKATHEVEFSQMERREGLDIDGGPGFVLRDRAADHRLALRPSAGERRYGAASPPRRAAAKT